MTIPVFLRTFCKYTQKPRAMQMRKHLTGPFRDRQKTSVLWMLRNGSVIQAVRLALPRREQYMWTRSGQISQKPRAMQTCLQLPRRNSINGRQAKLRRSREQCKLVCIKTRSGHPHRTDKPSADPRTGHNFPPSSSDPAQAYLQRQPCR